MGGEADPEVAPGRCGYTSKQTRYPELGRLCCYRPTHGDSDRCVWHADPSEKSLTDLDETTHEPGERLDEVRLRGMALGDVDWFSECVLVGGDFRDTNVRGADFSGADLRESSFGSASAHGADFTDANLEDATGAEADFRGATFRNAKIDHMDFTHSRIDRRTEFGRSLVYESKFVHADDPRVREQNYEAALETYKSLEALADSHALTAEANRYYRREKDLRRRFSWQTGDYLHAIAAEISRLFTGYGIRPARLIAVSFGIILIGGMLYPVVGIQTGEATYSLAGLRNADLPQVVAAFVQSLFFSTVTFTTLGYGNIEPATPTAQYIAATEALLGSVLTALLVAVFMKSRWLR